MPRALPGYSSGTLPGEGQWKNLEGGGGGGGGGGGEKREIWRMSC